MTTIGIEFWQKVSGLFQAFDVTALQNERLSIILGFITLVAGIAAFLSCRTCVAWLRRIGMKDPVTTRGYSLFYKYHLYYWWALGVFLITHLMMAILHTGLPEAGDPDAGVHWIILGMGLSSGFSFIAIFSSCRVLPRLFTRATSKDPFQNIKYRIFFRYHSYYWWILIILVFVHVMVGINHSGVWPGT